MNFDDTGGDVARAERTLGGTLGVMEGAPPARAVGPYQEKYGGVIARIGLGPDGFAGAYSVEVRAAPTRWRVW